MRSSGHVNRIVVGVRERDSRGGKLDQRAPIQGDRSAVVLPEGHGSLNQAPGHGEKAVFPVSPLTFIVNNVAVGENGMRAVRDENDRLLMTVAVSASRIPTEPVLNRSSPGTYRTRCLQT